MAASKVVRFTDKKPSRNKGNHPLLAAITQLPTYPITQLPNFQPELGSQTFDGRLASLLLGDKSRCLG